MCLIRPVIQRGVLFHGSMPAQLHYNCPSYWDLCTFSVYILYKLNNNAQKKLFIMYVVISYLNYFVTEINYMCMFSGFPCIQCNIVYLLFKLIKNSIKEKMLILRDLTKACYS